MQGAPKGEVEVEVLVLGRLHVRRVVVVVLVDVGDGPPAPHDALVLAVDEDLTGGVVDVLEAVRLAHDVAADDAEPRRPIRLLLLLRELFDVAVHGGGAERRLALHVLYAAAVRELDEQAHEGELAATVAALDGHIVLHSTSKAIGTAFCLPEVTRFFSSFLSLSLAGAGAAAAGAALSSRAAAVTAASLSLAWAVRMPASRSRRFSSYSLAFADAAVSPMGMGSPLYVAACACFRWPSL